MATKQLKNEKMLTKDEYYSEDFKDSKPETRSLVEYVDKARPLAPGYSGLAYECYKLWYLETQTPLGKVLK
jgi:hypothetical protein